MPDNADTALLAYGPGFCLAAQAKTAAEYRKKNAAGAHAKLAQAPRQFQSLSPSL